MSYFILDSMLADPNSPIYDWRFWTWCLSTTSVGIAIACYIERKKP